MIEKSIGIISGMKIATVNGEADDGTKVKIPVCEFKVESSDIDYDIIAKHFPLVYKHLCADDSGNILSNAEFDCKKYGLFFEFYRQPNKEENNDDLAKYRYENIQLVKMKVVYKENIPTYCFTFHKNIEKTDYYLNNATKVNIVFTFDYNE